MTPLCCEKFDLVVDWKIGHNDATAIIRWENLRCAYCGATYEFLRRINIDSQGIEVCVQVAPALKVM